MKFWFCFLLGLTFWKISLSYAQVPTDQLRKYAISSFYAEANGYAPGEKHFVFWQGKPTAVPIHVQAGVNIPSNVNGYGGSVQPEIVGIKVRVRAFDAKGKQVGQINKSEKADDTFLTGQRCTFTPPAPGNYRLTLEVLSANSQVIPVLKSGNRKTNLQAMNLLVYRAPTPQLRVSLSAWTEVAGKTDLYERALSIGVKNALIPNGYAYRDARSAPSRWLNVKYRVVPQVSLRNLNPKTLQQITWLSTTESRIDTFNIESKVATQYFHYDPTRDAPRDLSYYEVKAWIAP